MEAAGEKVPLMGAGRASLTPGKSRGATAGPNRSELVGKHRSRNTDAAAWPCFPQQAQEAKLTLRILTVTQDWAF